MNCLLVFSLSLFFFGCGGAQTSDAVVNSAAPTPEVKRDELQESLYSMQVGDFDFVFVFRRPDDQPLTGDDKKYLKDNAPFNTNRWNLTSDGKIAIAGSNYKFTPENLDALKSRFIVENRSRVQEESPDVNANAATNKLSKTNRIKK